MLDRYSHTISALIYEHFRAITRYNQTQYQILSFIHLQPLQYHLTTLTDF